MKKIIVFFILILMMFSSVVFATEMTRADINTFVAGYNGYFGLSLTTSGAYPTSGYNGVVMWKDGSSYYIALVTGDTTVSVEDTDISFTDSTLIYKVTTTGITKDGSRTGETGNNVMVSDGIILTSVTNAMVLRYNITSGTISKEVQALETTVNTLNTKVNALDSEVSALSSDISTATGEISEQLDTVISNQSTINNNINKTNTSITNMNTNLGGKIDTTNQELGELNTQFEDFANADTSSTDSSSSSILTENEFDIEDPTADTLTNTFQGIANIMTTVDNSPVSVDFMGEQVELRPDYFKIPDGPIKSLFVAYFCYWVGKSIILDIRKTINKFKEGNFEQVGSEDITADMV